MKTDEIFFDSPMTRECVAPLSPHRAKPVVETIGEDDETPTILLSLEAYQDTHYIMENAGSNEVGWLGTVQRTENGDYLIGKVFLFSQQVSGSHCEFDQADIGRFYTEMLKQDPANKAILNSILFWGHLHPGDMTSPSGQDEDQMELFAHNPFFIRGIFTRMGKCVFTFYDYKRGIKITDCPWRLHLADDARREAIAREIKEKVRAQPIPTIHTSRGRHGR